MLEAEAKQFAGIGSDFAQRFSAWELAHATFMATAGVPGGCDDDLADALCAATGIAFNAMLAAQAPDNAATAAKLAAYFAWYEGSVHHPDQLLAIAAEAAAL